MSREVDIEDCMLYAGPKSALGYGSISYYIKEEGGRVTSSSVHRLMYEKEIGEIPSGYEIDHLCKIPPCINPEHLEAVTPLINTMRRYGVNLCKRGHRLTNDNIYLKITNKGNKGRQCKECVLIAGRKRYWKNKENLAKT